MATRSAMGEKLFNWYLIPAGLPDEGLYYPVCNSFNDGRNDCGTQGPSLYCSLGCMHMCRKCMSRDHGEHHLLAPCVADDIQIRAVVEQHHQYSNIAPEQNLRAPRRLPQFVYDDKVRGQPPHVRARYAVGAPPP